MKRRIALVAALVGLSSAALADSIVFSDDFSDAALDPTKWTMILPYGHSSLVQSGGSVTTTGRGILATANSYSQPYVINGTFTMLDHFEHFNIVFRTDLSEFGTPFAERSGMAVSFSNDGDQISIQQFTEGTPDWQLLAVKNYTLITGQSYFFSIFDDGFNVSLAVNGISELTASDAYATGNRIALYSREFGGGSKIDAVNIVRVPDGGATVALLLAGMTALLAMRGRVTIASV